MVGWLVVSVGGACIHPSSSMPCRSGWREAHDHERLIMAWQQWSAVLHRERRLAAARHLFLTNLVRMFTRPPETTVIVDTLSTAIDRPVSRRSRRARPQAPSWDFDYSSHVEVQVLCSVYVRTWASSTCTRRSGRPPQARSSDSIIQYSSHVVSLQKEIKNSHREIGRASW